MTQPMNRKPRTPKQQARFDAATARAVQVAQDRHTRLWNAQIAREEQQVIDNWVLHARCVAAEEARDLNAENLPKLRDSLRRIVYIHDGVLGLEDVGDTLAREARRALEAVGARV